MLQNARYKVYEPKPEPLYLHFGVICFKLQTLFMSEAFTLTVRFTFLTSHVANPTVSFTCDQGVTCSTPPFIPSGYCCDFQNNGPSRGQKQETAVTAINKRHISSLSIWWANLARL